MAATDRRWRAGPTGWLAPAAVAVAGLGFCAAAGLTDPTRPGSGLPPCPFHALTGWACPVCGSTRMLHELIHGHLGTAARYNAVVLALLPVLLYGWLGWTLQRLGYRRLPTWRVSPRVQQLGLALWFTFAVLRNLPWAPMQALHI